ncbi:hypothetical protein N865_15880 [Intrasporangium oryzae NRRL B-24470]|uniref:Carbon monoxide dehydrogenase n=1 Tax=Intrasporangium oryzae NRRL B-24470 TaxID=1386089 RepID=W9G523_9MICO|nr:SRPBCC domain-containing protein [Intrasporangium oryzae]EWT00412.1 hypothetical protein N865_15880 [Intrasporangium oryzae NRRL B-24470]
MRLTHRQTLDAPVDDVWAAFMDLYRIGRSFPGAAVTEVHGDDFVGSIRAKLGPFTMTFDGTGSMTERDEDARKAHLEATGRERHGLGNADIAISLTLKPARTSGAGADASAARTDARLVTDLVFVGAPMDFGTGLVQRASDPLVTRFLTRMASPESAVANADDEDDLDIVRSAADLFGSFASSLRGRGPSEGNGKGKGKGQGPGGGPAPGQRRR